MVYLFDIDGTLTRPRQSIDKDFEEFFYNWMLNKKVYLVTGSDRKKINEQLSRRIIDCCSGIFSCMANEFYIADKQIYENKLNVPQTLIPWLEQQIEYTQFLEKTGNHIEQRPGMINFSVVGRNASKEQRERYELWDKTNGERLRISTYINRKFSDLEACVGGQISVDIQMKGLNKSQASKYIRENVDNHITFFGDKCDPSGNDYAIVQDLIQNRDGIYHNILNTEQLKKILSMT